MVSTPQGEQGPQGEPGVADAAVLADYDMRLEALEYARECQRLVTVMHTSGVLSTQLDRRGHRIIVKATALQHLEVDTDVAIKCAEVVYGPKASYLLR